MIELVWGWWLAEPTYQEYLRKELNGENRKVEEQEQLDLFREEQ